ncbi:MAG: hypothetical protein A2831_01715 [Candidatus Yanofskybacteria bacterium RIFCSPHIGHO2_01_FULL_44_17]|uniref:DUF5671 domain-containing protein n=1 Tax=Candidatus Yanofskybacteria bacterium RIFCSPHIGHO2_01_FULL_44_17 TaxID=1802668 RepID=A0A1F8EWR5_9BACT|nr:MAG: hypothetical protein A2831_01715 [Candidatus Yanofskybacteria bacterium RIFCSPHIGHO2_01_FULL_44_17]
MHLLAVVTLYVSVVAFITLWWQYINVLFPDILQNQGYYNYANYYDPIRLAMAALIVVFPIHIIISWLIGKEFKADPEKREIRVRKWLWYITLFISAVTIIVDLITLINNFLRGELTTQFFLKVLVVLIVAGAVFVYYLWDLKKRERQSGKPKLVAWLATAVILASIAYGFFLIGTPATQRDRRFDEQRVNNLSIIQSEVINYWINKNKLPADLSDLKNDISGFVSPTDPETGVQLDYTVTGVLSFRLCADFKTPSKTSDTLIRTPAFYPYNQNWDHDAGRTCFDRTIDPELYKRSGIEPVPLKY